MRHIGLFLTLFGIGMWAFTWIRFDFPELDLWISGSIALISMVSGWIMMARPK
jgi:hypothetical protein